jgi:formylmethanofuran dehydrogenase subunit C
MKDLLVAMATTGIAGLGGALAVYGSYDDSPGGTLLLGIIIVLGAMALSARMARRAPST